MAQIRNLKDTATDATIYPVTTPQAVYGLDTLLTQKVDKIPGKGLSTNDYDNASKTKLDNLLNRDALNASLDAKQNTLQPSSDITPDPRTNQLSLTRSAKMALFIDQWNTACGTYGRYDPDNAPDPEHPFYLNTLWLTYKEALEVFSSPRITYNNMAGYVAIIYSPKTLILAGDYTAGAQVSLFNAFRTVSFVALRVSGDSHAVYTKSMDNAFYNASQLRYIYGSIVVHGVKDFNEAFYNCRMLEHINLKNLTASISFADSPKLSLASIRYMIDHAANTSAITITVHPDVYAKLIGDTTNTVAAALTPEELAQWQQILTAAAEKQITFATV